MIRRVILATVVVAAAGWFPGGPARADSGQAAPSAPALTVFDQTPWVGQTGSWRLTLKVSGAPPGARVVIRVYDGLTSREAFLASLTDQELRRPRWSDFPMQPVDQLPPTADGNRLAQFDIPVDDGGPLSAGHVNPTQFGVFPVEVRVESASGDPVSRLVTHLVRFPDTDDEVEPLQAALLVNVDAPPALQDDGTSRLPPGATERLSGTARQLAGHPGVPLTIVPTAETLVGLGAPSPDGDPEALDMLRSTVAAGNRQVLGGTYVRLDQPAWVESGLGGELGVQRLVGSAAIGDQLGLPPDGRTAVVDADATPRSLSASHQLGVDRLVVPDQALEPLDESVTRTLTRPFQMVIDGQPVEAAQIDPGLQSAFLRSPDDPALGAHEMLAELAMILYEAPGTSQAVVLSPPPGVALPSAFLGPLLDGLASGAPTIRAATLDQLFDAAPVAGANGQYAEDGPRLVRTLGPNVPPSMGAFPQRMRQAQAKLASYRGLLVDPNAEADNLGLLLLVAGSTELTQAEQLTRVGHVSAVLDRRLGSIVVPDTQTVTLTSRSGQIPLTVRNLLDVSARVVIEVDANNRLQFPDLTDRRRSEIIPAGGTLRIPEQVRPRGSGVVPMTVKVRTPDGRLLGSTDYRVQSTAVSGVGLFITIAAVAFLAIWWARNWRVTRAERQARAAAAAEMGDTEDTPQPVA